MTWALNCFNEWRKARNSLITTGKSSKNDDLIPSIPFQDFNAEQIIWLPNFFLFSYSSPMENRPKAFYLHPIPNFDPSMTTWYCRRPVGIHWIQGFLKEVMHAIGEEGKYTPHSLRATTDTTLYHEKVDEQLIMEQTGHVSNAVRKYKRTSSAQKQEVL